MLTRHTGGPEAGCLTLEYFSSPRCALKKGSVDLTGLPKWGALRSIMHLRGTFQITDRLKRKWRLDCANTDEVCSSEMHEGGVHFA